jgi:hypothetical protein
MKRLIIAISLVFILLLATGCGSPPENYHLEMTALEDPIRADVDSNLLTIKYLWFTKEYVMNDEETLFYAPKSVRIEGKLYLNDEEAYYIRRDSGSFLSDEYEWENVDEKTLKEIFRE